MRRSIRDWRRRGVDIWKAIQSEYGRSNTDEQVCVPANHEVIEENITVPPAATNPTMILDKGRINYKVKILAAKSGRVKKNVGLNFTVHLIDCHLVSS